MRRFRPVWTAAAVAVVLSSLVGCAEQQPSDIHADLSHLEEGDNGPSTGDASGEPSGDPSSAEPPEVAIEHQIVDVVSGASFMFTEAVEAQPAELPGVHSTFVGRSWTAPIGEVTCSVSVFDLEGRTMSEEAQLNLAAQAHGATVGNEGVVMLDGHEAMVADLTVPDGSAMRLATVAVGEHIYQVSGTDAAGSMDAATGVLDVVIGSVDVP